MNAVEAMLVICELVKERLTDVHGEGEGNDAALLRRIVADVKALSLHAQVPLEITTITANNGAEG